MNRSDSIKELAGALAKAQGEMPPLAKDATGQVGQQKTRYASLDAVIDVISPVFAANGIAIVQFPISAGPRVGVETIITHTSGEWMSHEFMLPALETAQGFGSGLSYARRYALLAVSRIAPEDDDGAAAMPARRQANQRQAAPRSPVSSFDPDPDTGEIRDEPTPIGPKGPLATDHDLQLFYIDATGKEGLGFTHEQVLEFAKRETLKGISVTGLGRLYKALKAVREQERTAAAQ